MNQPLDFSAGAPRRAAPPTPPPPPTGSGRKRALAVLAVVALVGGVGFAAVKLFGGDSGKDDALEAARHCQLAVRLDEVSVTTGAASAPGVFDGPPEKIKAAVDQMGATLQELRSTAPAATRGDVRVVVDALDEAAGGDPTAVRSARFTEAARRAKGHRDATCTSGGGSSGDG